ncbi:protein SNORC [Epinephelus moara]|uniref:protein SNORC n=1 Tax=Epinephelus moara TaxID=300413 RepID=UPI00214F01E0|nr:protein SNORC [Epinephelus moara]
MWPEEFGVGGPCDDVLTKSTLSRQSCAHLVPPLPSPLSCLPLPLLCSPVLFSCSSPKVCYSFEVRGVLETLSLALSDISSLSATMVHSSSFCRFLLLIFLGLLVAFVHTDTVADSTIRDSQDTMSGEPPSDVTTKDPFQDMTEQSFTFDYEETTHSQALDEEEGVLGPGAITAIVIAVFLGASVLLALIVITLRKFTAS